MISVNSSLELHLKNAGFSLTKPRQLVFEALRDHGPLTMRDLYAKLSPQVNRTTVYRVVELFENLKIAQRISKGWKYQLELTDEFIPHHHHFTCTNCHQIISFGEPEGFKKLLGTLSNHYGFVPSGHTLEIEGICSTCRANI